MASTAQISSFKFVAVGPKGKEWATQLQCLEGVATTINLRNAVQNGDRAVNLRYMTIDNIGNAGLCSVQESNLSWNTPPFTRETYELPEELTAVTITSGKGTVTVTLAESKLTSDQTNSLAVQQTAAATLTYQFVNYSANQSQLTTDVNKTLLFTPTAADMVYTLLLGSSAGNGWLDFCANEGTKNVAITPTVGNTINGLSSFTLAPGQSCVLLSDGANWWAFLVSPVGGETLLADITVSVATAQINITGIPSTYNRLRMEIVQTQVSSGTGIALNHSLSDDGGTTFETHALGATSVGQSAWLDLMLSFYNVSPNAKLLWGTNANQGGAPNIPFGGQIFTVRTGIINYWRLSWSNAANFTVGTRVRLYGCK